MDTAADNKNAKAREICANLSVQKIPFSKAYSTIPNRLLRSGGQQLTYSWACV